MGKKKKNKTIFKVRFCDVVELAKERIVEENLTFDEIEKSIGVDAEFCRVLFDERTSTADNISRLMEFLKINMKPNKIFFKMYSVRRVENIIKVRRRYSPECTMYYDRDKDVFYKFSFKLKVRQGKTYTDILKNEMRDAVFKHMENESKKDIN